MEESQLQKKNRMDEIYEKHQKVYKGMVFDGRNGGIPTTVRNILLRMGWQEFSRDEGH